ncbi:hypothetical protein [Pseudomonas schmalbachii]|uniref:Uncharacterized protein n=1 Tax=Pseudomonas schmalbachii TaxID=2816993 RepID=A0ABS3TL78_9PSED|nr:hypothetical protein [Pseudomonas schmalbachii]MBO3274163.1 hypothetical protein [Pseudomonas schmalbachii]
MARQFPMIESRAQAIGVKPKVLAARTKRSLKSIRTAMEKLAEPWTDIDGSVETAQDELLAALDRFEEHINGTVEWLTEAAE